MNGNIKMLHPAEQTLVIFLYFYALIIPVTLDFMSIKINIENCWLKSK